MRIKNFFLILAKIFMRIQYRFTIVIKGDVMKNLILLFSVIVIFFGCTGTQMVHPVLKENIEPVYPYEAKINGLEGTVDILLSLNELGDVTNTKTIKSSGHKILDEAAIDYSKGLKFEPTSITGTQIPVFVRWRVDFKLKGIDVENGKISVLVFSKTDGYRHESIVAGKSSLQKLANENNFRIDFSEDSLVFNESKLSEYNVIIFLNTTGNILNEEEKMVFKKFIQNKGGFVGIHSAIETENNWEWYGKLLGTRYQGPEKIQKVTVRITEKNHPSTKDLPYQWEIDDEWHIFTNKLAKDIKVLAVVDKIELNDSDKVMYQPFCWYHEFNGGRCWYTTAGHKTENYSDPLFMKHILGGIKYAAGLE
jgi:TonB family protein